MTDSSLRDVLTDFGGSQLAEAIVQEYHDDLNPEMLMGEPLGDIRDVSQAMRKYDHGEASTRVVSEVGVRASFNPERVSLEDLNTDGEIRARLRKLAQKHLECDVERLDLHHVTESEYVIWIVVDVDD